MSLDMKEVSKYELNMREASLYMREGLKKILLPYIALTYETSETATIICNKYKRRTSHGTEF